MPFQAVAQLLARFRDLGATRVFCKHLFENDNAKQQIYLGGSFEVLSFFPFDEVTEHPGLKEPNFKAPIDLRWVDVDSCERAQGAQLILYPKYPEVRLSGFLAGCKTAPSKYLQPVPKAARKGKDGRVLVFGTTPDKITLAFLAPGTSAIASELLEKFVTAPPDGLFLELTVPTGSNTTRAVLLATLRQIHKAGFHWSRKLDGKGGPVPYSARNGGGYTLEALLGIKPNAGAVPDFMGWEIKAYSSDRVTLMTPEPKGGFYGERGVEAFVMKYGHDTANGTRYFTGSHKVDVMSAGSGLTLVVRGFNAVDGKVTDVNGAICLIDERGKEAASWPFSQLMVHWNKKHAFAAYVPFISKKEPPEYKYESPVLLGEHTEFPKYLAALSQKAVIFDPGSKVTNPGTSHSKVKARSQFRISVRNLPLLYKTLIAESLKG